MTVQFFQLFGIGDLDAAAGQLDHPLILKISKHSGDHFPMGTQVIGNGLMGDFQMTGPFDRHFLQQECGYTLVETLPHDLLHEPHDIGEARGHQFVGIVGNRRRSFHDALINFGRYYPKVSVLFRLNGHFELNGTRCV